MHNIRDKYESLRRAVRDNQALAPGLGMVVGILLALAVERFGSAADPRSFAITVAQARSSLLSTLGLVFTGLSIVLALTAVTTQNMAAKFSPRLLQIKLRTASNKIVLAGFSLTAAFILSSQVLIRGRAGDALAPPLTLITSVVLLVVSGVLIVAYVNSTLQSMRVDRTVSWIAHRVVRAAEAQHRAAGSDSVLAELRIDRPEGAVDIEASDDGYIVEVDTRRLDRLAERTGACIFFDAGVGRPVVRGETIGWVAASITPDSAAVESAVECLSVAPAPDAAQDVGYTLRVLCDVALLALSPAVNDPNTGVTCVEALTGVLGRLARLDLGTRVRRSEDGQLRVIVRGSTAVDHISSAGRQILHYGAGDSLVTAALLRLAEQAERMAPTGADRRTAATLAADVQTASVRLDAAAPTQQ